MLRTTQNMAQIPDYVLHHYSKFINEKELMALMQLMAIPDNKKASWELAANRMGYSRFSAFKGLIDDMANRGVIGVNRYEVDASPLWVACLNASNEPEPAKPTIKAKEKKVSSERHGANILNAEYLRLEEFASTQRLISMIAKNIKDFGYDAVEAACQIQNEMELNGGYTPAGWVGVLLTLQHYENYDVRVIKKALIVYKFYRQRFEGKPAPLVKALCEVVKDFNETDTETYIKYCIDAMEQSKGFGYRLRANQIVGAKQRWLDAGKPVKFGTTQPTNQIDAFA